MMNQYTLEPLAFPFTADSADYDQLSYDPLTPEMASPMNLSQYLLKASPQRQDMNKSEEARWIGTEPSFSGVGNQD